MVGYALLQNPWYRVWGPGNTSSTTNNDVHPGR